MKWQDKFQILIALAIVTVIGVYNMINHKTRLPIANQMKLSPVGKSVNRLQELREKAWPYIPDDLSDEDFQTLLTRLKKASKVKKYILNYFRKPGNWTPPKIPKWCGYCEVTRNPEMIRHPETKAVVILYKKFNERTLHEINRRDSDVYSPYGRISGILQTKLKKGLDKNISLIFKGKTKIVAAVISNCGSTSGAKTRLEIVNKMKRLMGINMDTLGNCFGKRVEGTKSEFVEKLQKYKFYLAFENAFHCRDYITEKFMVNAYLAGAVPVVVGATKAEYEAVAPKGSFIFAEDFTTVESLVDYLKYLDEHDEEYLKYFRWIEAFRSLISAPNGGTSACRLCRLINGINIDDMIHANYNKTAPERPMFTDDIAPRTVKNLKQWFYDTENDDCFDKHIKIFAHK